VGDYGCTGHICRSFVILLHFYDNQMSVPFSRT
jgi:hypothetical protein